METLTIDQDGFTGHELDMQARLDLQTRCSEIVSGSMRTDFELRFTGVDLIGEDSRSLTEIADKGIADAEFIALVDPGKAFELPRRIIEREETTEAIEMAKGNRPNTMVVVSDHPHALKGADKDVGGYSVKRQKTMLRVLTLEADGNVRMVSQSLDGSNRQALEAIYSHFDIEPEEGELLGQRIQVDLNPYDQENIVDNLMGIYDLSLTEQFGGEWYAGRRPADLRNTYEFVCRQTDLIELCVELQREGELDRDKLYDLAAYMQERFDQDKGRDGRIVEGDKQESVTLSREQLYREMEGAGISARRQGLTFSGCGETLTPDGAADSTESKLEQAGYGNESTAGNCEYVSKKCPVCDAKNVKTTVKVTKNGKKHVSGSCGCSKLYNSDGSDAGAVVSFANIKSEVKTKEKSVSDFLRAAVIKTPEKADDN